MFRLFLQLFALLAVAGAEIRPGEGAITAALCTLLLGFKGQHLANCEALYPPCAQESFPEHGPKQGRWIQNKETST